LNGGFMGITGKHGFNLVASGELFPNSFFLVEKLEKS